MTSCVIALGSNIGNELGTPTQHLAAAVAAFVASPDFSEVQSSSLYRSKAFGVTDQPDFFNAVLQANTRLEPLALLDFCQSLEQKAGRVRRRHWGERSLDVDVLLYGDATLADDRLTVPHPEMTKRNFVLLPLLELCPTLKLHGQPINKLAAANDWAGLQRLPACKFFPYPAG